MIQIHRLIERENNNNNNNEAQSRIDLLQFNFLVSIRFDGIEQS